DNVPGHVGVFRALSPSHPARAPFPRKYRQVRPYYHLDGRWVPSGPSGRESLVGEATTVPRNSRSPRERTTVRRRAVGTRDRIIAHLALVAEVADGAGMASTRLAEAVGYPGSSVAFAQLLSGMERDGLIAREVRGKRTYRITLADGAAARTGLDGAGRRLPSAPAMAPAEFDYDELARRLLVQVVRRLAVTPADLQQTV